MDTILRISVFILFVWLSFLATVSFNKSIPINVYRKQARKQFTDFRTHSSTPEFIFIGEEAEIIKSDESIINNKGVIESYSLTCYARNSHGEYFMFVSNHEARPYFKHISHANAKIILGKDYREPT
jgi:hypothetical protein